MKLKKQLIALGMTAVMSLSMISMEAFTYEGEKEAVTTQKNLLVNAGFEDVQGDVLEIPNSWIETDKNPEASVVKKGNAHTGEYYLSHGSDGAYRVSTYQEVGDLENGTYTLSAWVKTTAGQDYASMYVNGYGGEEKSVVLHEEAKSEWTQIVIKDIYITTGTCKLGFYSQDDKDDMGGTEICVDDISLVKDETSEEPIDPDAPSEILNSGFEDESEEVVQLPKEWKEELSNPEASYAEKKTGHEGDYYLIHNSESSYQVTTYQNLAGLENGTYTLSAWVKTTGGQGYANMFINGYGGQELSYPLYKNPIDEWTQVSIRDIEITTGQCKLGFYSQSPAGETLYVDDVKLEKQTKIEKAPMRWNLSPENPMFQIMLWEDKNAGRECTIEKEWEAVDPSLRENTVPVFGPLFKSGKYVGDEEVEWLERQMDYCERNGIDFMIQTATWATISYWGYIPDYQLARYFEEYEHLIGLQQVEVTTGYEHEFYDNRYDGQYFKQNIDVCAKYGGIFVYKDQSYNRYTNSYAILGEKEDLLDKIRENSENCVIMWKANGIGQHYENTSYAMGYWLAGITSNWGVNAEAWLNVEQGYNTIGADAATRKSGGVEGGVFRTPEAQLGQMMMMCAANGATIYSYEDAWQANSWQGEATPAYEMVLKPFQQRLLQEKLIPTKEEVLSKVKVAYHQSELVKDTPEITEDFGVRLYNGLYGIRDYTVEDFEKSGVQFEWFPHTGRYLVLPILPYYATEEELSVFPNIINHDSFVNEYDNGGEKYVDYFNSLYPEEYIGSSWAQKMNNTWFLMNPSENHIKESDFDLPISNGNCSNISGMMDEQTFSYIKENENALKIFASNLRVDKQSLDNQSRIVQNVTVEEDGIYDLSAWVATDDTSATLNISVNDGPREFANISKNNQYQKYQITGIQLEKGDTVKVYLTGAWNSWVDADDFSLEKQGGTENILVNPGFEDGENGWSFEHTSTMAYNNPHGGSNHINLRPGPTAYGWSDTVPEHQNSQFSFSRFFDEYYIHNYDTREMRTTTYVLENVVGDEPELEISGENYNYVTNWDETAKTYTITLTYNGYVDMTVRGTSEEKPEEPENPDDSQDEDGNDDQETDKENEEQQPESVKTGDSTNVMLFGMILVLALAGIVSAVVMKKKW